MEVWALAVVCCLVVSVFAGKDTDEELAHYILKEPSTDMPWTSNERRINKMIEEEIIKFNYAPETTECPFDSQGRKKPTESKQPTWWNAYRQAKDGDRPDWSAEIKELIKNPRTYPPWTPSQESEPVQSRWKNIEPFTWRPGAPVINLRVKTDATTRPSGPQEPTTERSIILSSADWDTSEEEGGGGEGKTPPLNLAPLQKGYKEDNEYLKVKPRKKAGKANAQQGSQSKMDLGKKSSYFIKTNSNQIKEEKANENKEMRMRRERARRRRHNAVNQRYVRV